MTHIKEHCNTPRVFRRREGDLWACACGRLWRLGYFYNYEGREKHWQPLDEIKKKK